MDNNLRHLDRARAEVIKYLQNEPEVGLYNLSLSDLGLYTAINIIAEIVEKRVDLGDLEDTAFYVALEGFESFLGCVAAPGKEGPLDFAQYMAEFGLPFIQRPDGTIMHNPVACEIWREGFLESKE
jgi:hypothetical protein